MRTASGTLPPTDRSPSLNAGGRTVSRLIDPQAARYAVITSYPNADHDPEYCKAWIAAQLLLKQQGRLHDDRTVAIYEEHART